MKLKLLSISGVALMTIGSLMVHYLEKYLFSDWEFGVFMTLLVVMDTVLGFAKHWRLNNISSKGFGDVLIKVMIYGSLLVLTHILTNFTISGEKVIVFKWIDYAVYTGIMLREAISILENITAIKPDILPAYILKKLKQFNENGTELNQTESQ